MPIIIGVVALLVIIVVFVVFGAFDSSKTNARSAVSTVNQGVMVATSAPVEKVKEKKKKIKYAQLFSQMDSGDTSKILGTRNI